jgi:hypothetical protein
MRASIHRFGPTAPLLRPRGPQQQGAQQRRVTSLPLRVLSALRGSTSNMASSSPTAPSLPSLPLPFTLPGLQELPSPTSVQYGSVMAGRFAFFLGQAVSAREGD